MKSNNLFHYFFLVALCIGSIAYAQTSQVEAPENSPARPTEGQYLGWGSLALINAGLAQIKNKQSGGEGLGGFGWFIISCFIGPLATFLIVVFKD